MSGRLITADVLDGLGQIEDGSVALVCTSPPYADARKKHYGGPPPSEYCDWYAPIANRLRRVLAPDGSYVLNIKERVIDGERSPYVHDLIRLHRDLGWKWIEDYIWAKTTAMPGRFGCRLADGWEHCLHFALTTKPWFDRESTRRPSLPGVRHKITREAARIPRRQNKKSGFGHDARNFDPDSALGTNVIVAAGERNDVDHPAAYPLAIPGFFVPLLSPPGSTVLDPFVGSGTTCLAARQTGRHYIGIDRSAAYIATARKRIDDAQDDLLIPRALPPQAVLSQAAADSAAEAAAAKAAAQATLG